MFRRLVLALSVGLFLLCFRPLGAAAGDANRRLDVRVSFSFEGPANCPSEATAFSLIRNHSKKLIRSETSEDVVAALSIRVTENEKEHSGILFVTRPHGATEQRSVAGTNCREVVEALALTAALSVDPDASLFSDGADSQSKSGSDAASEEKNRNPNEGSALDKDQEGDSTPADERKSPKSNPALVFALGPELGVEKLMSSGWHLGVGASLTLRRRESKPHLPLEVNAGFRFLMEEPFKGTEQIKSSLGLLSFAGCPVGWGTTLTLLTCLGMDVGWLSVTGQDLEGAASVTRLYAAVRLSVPLRYEISRFQIWAAPTLALPLTHREFVVDPGAETVSETRAIGLQLAMGVRVVF
jgi:hypothetical protein